RSVPTMKHAPEPPRSRPIPITSSSGLPIAIVNANPRNATPSTEPSISAECARSIGSKNIVFRSSAMLVRMEKLTPAVSRATTLRKNIRGLLYSECLSTVVVLSWADIVILDNARSGQYTMILPVTNLRAFVLWLLAVPAFAQSISADRMRADLQFLASDALEGRLSLRRGSEVAIQWIAAEFAKAGLKPV